MARRAQPKSMRMQAVKFKHIEAFLEFLPEQELRITLE